MTLVASALAGGDCIDDADVLRTGGTAGAIGCVVKAPSTLGTFLRSFRWGHVRQPGEPRVTGPGLGGWSRNGPLTIDLDSTICETYGLVKEGARHHSAARGRRMLLREGRAILRPLPAGTGALRRGQGTTGAGRQRLLYPRHRRLP